MKKAYAVTYMLMFLTLDFFSKSLEAIKSTITKQTEENITKHKELASEVNIKYISWHLQ